MHLVLAVDLDGEVAVKFQFRVPGFGFRVRVLLCLVLGVGAWTRVAQAQIFPDTSNPKFTTRNTEPFFWADGMMRLDQLESYKRVGFNTIIVRLTWPPTTDGQIAPNDLLPQRNFANAAANLGLNIIYSLPPAPFGEERNFHISGETGPYRVMWGSWAQQVMRQLSATPNLLGWMLPDDPRGLSFTSNAGYARWIAANYGSVQVLNKQWSASFGSLEEVTLGTTRGLIARWRGPGPLPTMASDVEMRNYIERAQHRPANQNFAFHPAELALAHYEWDAYRALLDFWARTMRSVDPQRQVFSGRLPDYAQLLSLPPSVDVSVPHIAPMWAENDLASHNPQAVAIARRGGRFGAVTMLSTQLPGAPEDLTARLVPSWCDAALAQGARGIAFDSWPAISENANLRRSIRATLRRLQSEPYSLLWGQSPQATTAIVLTPLADGHTWRPPSDPLAAQSPLPPIASQAATAAQPESPPRGLFGFGEDMVSGEPSDLVYALRWGTLFGNVDYLSPDELGGAYSLTSGGVLKRYSTILLPQALSVPPAMTQELANYIAAGGTAVADLGLGAAQNGGQVLGLSESLTAIFGVVPTQLQALAFNLQLGTPHPLLPTWSALASTRPKELTRGDGPQGAAFAGPTVFGELAPGTVPLALAFQIPQRIAPNTPPGDRRTGDVEQTARLRLLRSWLTLRPFGAGNAIFAPFRLWSLWRPGYPGFDQFHGDLFAHAAQISHFGAQSLVPAPPGTPEGSTLYPEAINFQNAVVLINHSAAPNPPYLWFTPTQSTPGSTSGIAITPDPGSTTTSTVVAPNDLAAQVKEFNEAVTSNPQQPAIVQTSGAEQFLWSNALCFFPIGAAPAPTLGRHSPVPSFGGVAGDSSFVLPPSAHPVILHTFVPAQEMRVLHLIPVRVTNPTGGSVACRVREYSEQRVELRIWPNAQSATPTDTDWRVAFGAEGVARLAIYNGVRNGGYRVAPNSRHRIAITEISTDGKTRTATTNSYLLTADNNGTLMFEVKGMSLRIEIAPLEAPAITPTPIVANPSTPLTPAIVPDTPGIVPDNPAITPDVSPAIKPDTAPTESTPAETAPAERSAPDEDRPRRRLQDAINQDDDKQKDKPKDQDDNTGNDGLFHKRYNR